MTHGLFIINQKKMEIRKHIRMHIRKCTYAYNHRLGRVITGLAGMWKTALPPSNH